MLQVTIADDVFINGQPLSGAICFGTSIATVKMQDGSITTVKIADANVTADKITADAVTTDKVLDGNVTTDKILDGHVTTDKIANVAITNPKIANGAVSADHHESTIEHVVVQGTTWQVLHEAGINQFIVSGNIAACSKWYTVAASITT